MDLQGLVRKRDPCKATESIKFVPTHSIDFEAEQSKADMMNDLLDSDGDDNQEGGDDDGDQEI